jgi:hypothetical protein
MKCTRSSVCKYWRWPKTFESRWRIGSLHIFCLISCYHVSNNRMLQYKESSNWLVWHTFFVTQLFKYMTCRDEWSRHVAPCPPGKTPSFASKSSVTQDRCHGEQTRTRIMQLAPHHDERNAICVLTHWLSSDRRLYATWLCRNSAIAFPISARMRQRRHRKERIA